MVVEWEVIQLSVVQYNKVLSHWGYCSTIEEIANYGIYLHSDLFAITDKISHYSLIW